MIKLLLKPERHLNPEYLEYLRDQPCCACGRKPTKDKRTEPHHLITVGAGGADETACPLCWQCHPMIETLGLRRFEKEFKQIKLNLWMESKRFELAFRGIKIKA